MIAPITFDALKSLEYLGGAHSLQCLSPVWQHRAVGMLLCNSSWLCAGQNSAKVQINLKVKSVMVSQRTVTLDTMYFPAEHQPEIQSQSCTEWKNNVNV